MATLTSTLIVRLLDQVSGPARSAGAALLGLNRAATGATTMSGRLTAAIARNNQALDKTRGQLVDASIAGFGLFKALSAPLKATASFETMLEDIAQKGDLARGSMQSLGAEIRALAPQVNQSAANVAKGIDTLMGLGASKSDAMGLMPVIGRAATAYRAEITDLANAGYAALDNLKVPANEFGRALDGMAHAGKAGAFEIKDMAQYFPMLGAAYQSLGQKGVPAVVDLAAALQIARKGTGDASSAATNLSNVLQKLSAPQTRKAFEKMGVNLERELKKAAKAGLTPIEAIAEITNRTLKGDLSKLGDLFSDAQVQQGLRPLIQNIAEYRKIRKEAMAAQGVVEADYANRMKTAAAGMARLQIITENLSLSIGTALVPALISLGETIGPVAERIAKFAEANPQLTRWVVGATAALVAFRVALIGLKFIGLFGRGSLLYAIAAGLKAVGAGAAGVSLATAAIRSFTGAATGMAATATGVTATATALGQVNQKAIEAGRIKSPGLWGRAAFAGLGLGGLAANIPSDPEEFDEFGKAVDERMKGVEATLQKTIGTPQKWLGLSEPLMTTITRKLFGEGDGASSLAAATAKWPEAARASLDQYTSVIAAGGAGANAQATAIATQIRDALTIEGKLTIDTTQLQSALSLARQVGAARASAATPTGARAGGGPVTGGRSYLVGEKGPELWQAPGNGRIIPNSSTMSMMRSARGGLSAAADKRTASAPVNITTNVNVTGSMDRSMADTLAERIGQKVRRSLDGLHADLSMA